MSCTGACGRAYQRGFTLLELLLVLFVIGLMAGLTVMSVSGNPEREFRRDAARLQQLLGMAQDEAQFAGEELGFWVDPEGTSYSFYRFDDAELAWLSYEKSGFEKRDLPARYKLETEVMGDAVDLAELYKDIYKLSDKAGDDDEKPLVPWLVFFSDGQYTPFRLWLTHPAVQEFVFVLEGDGVGKIRVRKVDAGNKPDLAHE